MTLTLVTALNNAQRDTLLRLEIAGQQVGYIRPALAEKIVAHAPHLLGQTGANVISVVAENLSPAELTARFKTLHEELAAHGILPKPAPEFTDVRPRLDQPALCQINRNLIFPLGIISRGVHVVITCANGDFIVAQRSNRVFTSRGCYDVPVGGLLPAGKDPWDHVKVEAAEEAGLSAGAIQPDTEARVLTYTRTIVGGMDGDTYKPAFPFETDGGTNWDQVFYWTVCIPDHIVPAPRDGEVKSFQRMTPHHLLDSLRSAPEKWKTNSGVMFLEVLSRDPRYAHLFKADEHQSLRALLIDDPRPAESRGELVGRKTLRQPPKPS